MTARTITISLESASMIARMLPQAGTMNMEAMMAASEFLGAVLDAKDEPAPDDDPDFSEVDDGLGDRATR